MQNVSFIPDTLDDVWSQTKEMLTRGVADKKDPFQSLTLATYDGRFPNPRTVILRKFISHPFTLICHSDTRAGKIIDIQSHPEIAWHGWHPRRRVQIRLYGHARVFTKGALWDTEWNRIGLTSRTNYSPIMPPAQEITSYQKGQETYARLKETTEKESEEWKKHFAVIETQIEEVEWLTLHREGHRRARFTKQNDQWEGKWWVP
ncbi:MAG: hypothetical protein AAFQ83_15690 [Bacteroidota bacterium]